MSENLLKAIIKLLVIIAKEEGTILESEKKTIRSFLYENINEEDIPFYLQIFDTYVEEIITGKDDDAKITELTNYINQELTRAQKLIILVRCKQLIMADQRITEREKYIFEYVGKSLRFSKEDLEAVKNFVIFTQAEYFSDKYYIIAAEQDVSVKNTIQYQGLKGKIIFFKTPDVDICFFKYYGQDTLLMNNTKVIPEGHIEIFAKGSSLKGDQTDRLYFSDIVFAYNENIIDTTVSFVAENVSYKFQNGKSGLVNINIKEDSGKFFGIMGSSGSGKSTLLNILNGSTKPTDGSVRINGIDIHKKSKQINGVIGFVPQDDLLIEDLTVYQNLFYSAKLCFSNYNDQQLDDLVNTTIESLGLTEFKDYKVGNPLQKMISGGQRKRLNIGLELLRKPSVLFLDEPTSGLSSNDSENIMDLLKELSHIGKMLFVVIHQPSSEIFKMFDRLLILDMGGHQIYYGNPVDAVTYFKSIVRKIDKNQGICNNCGNVNPEQVFNIIETKVLDEYGRFTNKRKYRPKQWASVFQKKIKIKEIKERNTIPETTTKIANKLKQIGVFLKRDVLTKLSNRQYILINLLEAPILALILSSIAKYTPKGEMYTFHGNEDIPVFFFMSVIVALFIGLTISAEEIIKERKILKREAFLNLSKLSFLLSKSSLLFILSAIQTVLFVLIGASILEIKDMTLWYWIILFSVSCFANVLGLNISSAFNSVITVYIIIPLLLIPQLLLSGVVINFDKLNKIFSNDHKVPLIGELMASRWAMEALMVTQFRDNSFEKEFYEHDKRIAENTYMSVYAIKYLRDYLRNCHNNPKNIQNEKNLKLIQNEIKKQLSIFGKDKLPSVNKLNIKDFDEITYKKADRFLGTLQRIYNKRRKEAKEKREEKLKILNADQQKFLETKHKYHNKQISYLVRNIGSEKKIIADDGELVQKVYPIYARNEFPKYFFDFRANMYYPEKYFGGYYIDTKVFNVLVIWSMTIFLFIALYFDWLKKIVSGKRKSS